MYVEKFSVVATSVRAFAWRGNNDICLFLYPPVNKQSGWLPVEAISNGGTLQKVALITQY